MMLCVKQIKYKKHTEFVLGVKAIANSLLVVGDVMSEQDQIDSTLNLFVMQIYGAHEPQSLYMMWRH